MQNHAYDFPSPDRLTLDDLMPHREALEAHLSGDWSQVGLDPEDTPMNAQMASVEL